MVHPTGNDNYLNLTRIGLANKPVNRYTDAVKIGNWREDRIQHQLQGDLLANTVPPTFDWVITGKVGSCEDHIRKKEYQDHIVEKMACRKDEFPHSESDCGDSWIKPKFGKDALPNFNPVHSSSPTLWMRYIWVFHRFRILGMEGEMPTLRHRAPHYNELDVSGFCA
ncbi:hypothetical protein RvY_08962 [Ramazzottius varieornatus]|uniref:Uncharacterized protein n=1 Tax=Ramazzottius varieornatus TaxID=947166 RepID=A0A1D1VCA0_RAMVA|nr:hypothetical protein RvY_08962 [Ramazzottius varieornatus]